MQFKLYSIRKSTSKLSGPSKTTVYRTVRLLVYSYIRITKVSRIEFLYWNFSTFRMPLIFFNIHLNVR